MLSKIKTHFMFGLKISIALALVFFVMDLISAFTGVGVKDFVLNPYARLAAIFPFLNRGGG